MHGGVLLEGWCTLLLDGLVAGGLQEVVISPGSRSTPLVLAAHQHPDIRVQIVVDERAAAFLALGRVRITRRAVALIQTSGSALGHNLPAIMEARASGLPLLVLSADRPFELMDVRSPQTTDQTHLYGRQVVAFFEAGTPIEAPSALRAVRRLGRQAVARSQSPVPGPVHINVRAQKPLEPPLHLSSEDKQFKILIDSLRSEGAPKYYQGSVLAPSEAGLERIKRAVSASRRPLIVAGPAAFDEQERDAILAELSRLGAPTYLEGTSQLKFGPDGQTPAGVDMVFKVSQLRAKLAPDLIVQLGEPPIASGFQAALQDWPRVEHLVLTPTNYPDSTHQADIIEGHIATICQRLTRDLLPGSLDWDLAYLKAWQRATDRSRALAEQAIHPPDALTEAHVVWAARQAVPHQGALMVGNSLVVRHLDRYLSSGGARVRVIHQRGLSGIDGLVAGAIGVSQTQPCVLILGDVSARHDLGALALAELAGPQLTVVVVHNGGGRIFEALPLAEKMPPEDPVWQSFTTPNNGSLVPIASSLGWCAHAVSTAAQLDRVLQESELGAVKGKGKPTWIEALVSPHDATQHGKKMLKSLSEGMTDGY